MAPGKTVSFGCNKQAGRRSGLFLMEECHREAAGRGDLLVLRHIFAHRTGRLPRLRLAMTVMTFGWSFWFDGVIIRFDR